MPQPSSAHAGMVIQLCMLQPHFDPHSQPHSDASGQLTPGIQSATAQHTTSAAPIAASSKVPFQIVLYIYPIPRPLPAEVYVHNTAGHLLVWHKCLHAGSGAALAQMKPCKAFGLVCQLCMLSTKLTADGDEAAVCAITPCLSSDQPSSPCTHADRLCMLQPHSDPHSQPHSDAGGQPTPGLQSTTAWHTTSAAPIAASCKVPYLNLSHGSCIIQQAMCWT